MARNAARAVAVLLLAVGLAGCQDDAGGEALPASTTEPRPTSTTTLPEAPLTGLPVDDLDVLDRPAVTVKIDNDPKARPQAGLDKADIVYEERVEGSVVRFLAVFHSRDADLVGPIRSVRSTDPPVLAPLGGVFAYSGGIAAFERLVKRSGLTPVTERDDEEAFILRAGRQRPYKTFADVADLRAEAPEGTRPPPPLFSRISTGRTFAEDGGRTATSATVVFGSRTTALWTYDGVTGRWKRTTNGTPHRVENGTQLSFTTVVLQRVPYKSTGFTDRSAAGVDEAVVTGKGDAVVLAQGRQVKARWSKPTAKDATTFTDAVTGAPIDIPAGPVWVSLVPTDATITVLPLPPSGSTTSTSARRR